MTEISEEILISALQGKCTKQPVLTVMLRQKCLSSPTQKDRFTAETVSLTTGHPERTADTKPEFYFGTRISLREHESVSLRSSGLTYFKL
jgi:hypothetical protein